MALYEADPMAVKSPERRRACALFYSELRRLMSRAPLTSEVAEEAAE
jgi:hypothetical protein